MSAQTLSLSQFVNYSGDKNFAFLSKPPPSCPNIPLPPPPSSSPIIQTTFCGSYSSIIAWASLVQPGSPAPRSPQRRPSVSSSRRSSFSRLNRRPSISHGRAPSNHIVDTQKTPSVGDFDLTALGYTSVFVHLPKTPTTPSPYLRKHSGTTVPPVSKLPSPRSTYAHVPIPPMPSEEPPVKRSGLSRFRSLSILRSRPSKPKQQPSCVPPSPCSVTTAPTKSKQTKSKKHPAPIETSSATIAKRKRAKYAVAPPPPLANDLALMQFMEGGKMESHAKRVMEAQAKAAAGSGADFAVGDVYRDGNGGIWWDADEEWEYTHLLADAGAATAPIPLTGKVMTVDWEDFGAPEPCYDSFFPDLQANKENDHLTLERRDSVSSQDSDLDPRYLVTVPEHTLGGFNAPVEDRVLASHKIGGPGMSILSLPSRPRRKALHLNKAEFLVDIAAFGPRSPKLNVATPGSTNPKPKGQARRRPAPLKLAHQTQNAVVVSVRRPAGQVKTPVDSLEKVRKEFIADSFAPIPTHTKITVPTVPVTVNTLPYPPPQPIMNKKPSRRNMRGLFGRRE